MFKEGTNPKKIKSYVRSNLRRQRKAKNYLNKLLDDQPPVYLDVKNKRQQLYLFYDDKV